MAFNLICFVLQPKAAQSAEQYKVGFMLIFARHRHGQDHVVVFQPPTHSHPLDLRSREVQQGDRSSYLKIAVR